MPPSSITRRNFLIGGAAGVALACAPKLPPQRHVVFVNVDQLRKDAADRWMPEVTALSERGVVFEGMRSVAPWTYPSVLSLMTGLLPQQHGADGHLFRDRLSNFDPGLPTLQQLLRSAGYRTQAFVTNPFLQTWNAFHQGFDHYDAGFVESQGNLRGFGKLVWDPKRMFSDHVNAELMRYFDARPVTAPEFSYVHYIDVHGPWEGAPFAPRYESAVRFVDERIAELRRYFAERYADEMFFFVTSDHGRGWDRDVEIGHGAPWRKSKASLHDFNLRIPAAVLPSALVQGPQRVSEPCSNIDVVPTLLDWLGISSPVALPGLSLRPSFAGEALPGAGTRALYAKMSAFGRLSDAIVLGERKYLRFFDPRSKQLIAQRVFDLTNDPDETRSLEEPRADLAERFLEASGTQGLEYAAHFADPDPELLERLRALGYMK